MKQYDTIPYFGKHWDEPTIAFDKLDGSNLRFEFSRKRGFYKFGTRKNMIDKNTEGFGIAIDLFLTKYGDALTQVFNSKNYRNVLSFVCYAEFVGEKSAFGQHEFGKDNFDIVLFDVDQYKKGKVPPRRFIDDFGHTGIPKVIYEGPMEWDFVKAVQNNEFNLKEGVICKTVVNGREVNPILYYSKIKTNDWLERLKIFRYGDYELEMKQMNLETV
jgi:hypothetical protein